MSRIWFTTPTSEAEVLGRERPYGHHFAEMMTIRALNLDSPYSRTAVGTHTTMPAGTPLVSVHARLNMGDAFIRTPDGPAELTQIAHNTACATMAEPLVFLSRMHLQCEVHMWIPADQGQWFASLIRDGLGLGVMRQGMGWEDVAALAKFADGPIVSSYSICDGFPDAWTIAKRVRGFDPENDPRGYEVCEDEMLEWWESLTPEEQFAAGMGTVHPDCQVTEQNLCKTRFGPGHGWTAFELSQHYREEAV